MTKEENDAICEALKEMVLAVRDLNRQFDEFIAKKYGIELPAKPRGDEQ